MNLLVLQYNEPDEYGDGSGSTVPVGVFLAEDTKGIMEAIANNRSADVDFEEKRSKVNAFEEQWRKENPSPPHPKRIDRPKWPAGIAMNAITPEMRAERNAINVQNNALLVAYRTEVQAWKARMDQALGDYMTALGIPIEKQSMYVYGQGSSRINRTYRTYGLPACGLLEQRLTQQP